jgi:hypothetical protein
MNCWTEIVFFHLNLKSSVFLLETFFPLAGLLTVSTLPELFLSVAVTLPVSAYESVSDCNSEGFSALVV